MRPYRLGRYVRGTGVLLAGAALLSAGPALAQRGGGSDARPARTESAPARSSGGGGGGSAARPSAPSGGTSWRSGGQRTAPSGPTAWRSGSGSLGTSAPRTYGGGIAGGVNGSRLDPARPGGLPMGTRPSPAPTGGFRGGGTTGGSTTAPAPSRTGNPPWDRPGSGNAPWNNRRDSGTIWDRPGSGSTTGSGARPTDNRPGGIRDNSPRNNSPRGNTPSPTAPSRGTRPSPNGPSTNAGGAGYRPVPNDPNRHDRNPNERPDNPNEIRWRAPSRTGGTRPAPAPPSNAPSRGGSDYWNVRPGQYTYIRPTANLRPPSVNRSGWRDGYRFGGRRFHHVSVGYTDPWCVYQAPLFTGVRFYYPFYYTGPFVAGFYYSPFWSYGSLFPTYIYPERVIVVERRVYLRDVVQDDSFYDPYSDSTSTLRDTMDDIQAAWMDGDGGLLLRHVNESYPVRILQKGEYRYSLEPDDYRDITKDAINRVRTSGFEWTKVDRDASDLVRLEARHTFRDEDGDAHTIRLRYTVEKARGGWWITETDVAPW